MPDQHPHGVWIWYRTKLPTDYLERLVARRVKRVYLKVFDGRSQPMFWDRECSPQVVQEFNRNGISVYGWGFHYGTPDVDAQVAAVLQAIDCGIDGYILDLEGHIEHEHTHPHVERLINDLKPHTNGVKIGYSSFAHPGFHPDMPWRMLDDCFDLAFPQIYFEQFTFGPTNWDEVQACLQSQADYNLNTPMLPIFSSSPGAAHPAPVSELQFYLNEFAGASIYRLPHANDTTGNAWRLLYSDEPTIPVGPDTFTPLPTLTRFLRRGCVGDDVAALQQALNEHGFSSGPVDGDFGPVTESAVRAYQHHTGLSADGVVGPEVWQALGGEFELAALPLETGVRLRLASIAQVEADKQLEWTGLNCEAEKYLAPFRTILGWHTGCFAWCASFVTWCCREAGISIPDIPDGYHISMAAVLAWRYWAEEHGYWHLKNSSFVPQRGDLIIFEWGEDKQDYDYIIDHIGIVAGYTAGQNYINTYEGNCNNRTVAITRSMSDVFGFIRLPS